MAGLFHLEPPRVAAPEDEFPNATPRPWYFDGWDIFTSASSAGPRGDGHRMVVPLRAINDAVFHESQRVSDDDARLIVAAVNAFSGIPVPDPAAA